MTVLLTQGLGGYRANISSFSQDSILSGTRLIDRRESGTGEMAVSEMLSTHAR